MFQNKSRLSLLVGIVVCGLCFCGAASAQRYGSEFIGAGTNIVVRTTQDIHANRSDGRVYHGVVDQDVLARDGDVVIPRGSEAELIARRVSSNEMALDLESVTVNGMRYGVESTETAVGSPQEGIGANKRTGEFLGGGAVLGAIIGAIAGGGKGAAIGAAGGAAAGAGAQVLTRGQRIEVPAESMLTFSLTEPLRAGVYDRGYMRDGIHYHSGYGNDEAYRYQGGSEYAREKPGYGNGYGYPGGQGSISVAANNNVIWQAPADARVYVQVDNQTPQLFGSGQRGTEPAPWMNKGHMYTFILQDANGNEIARTARDMR